ncbi:hypothetical protein CMEL01_05922, partial [Colletotrichum melonis]
LARTSVPVLNALKLRNCLPSSFSDTFHVVVFSWGLQSSYLFTHAFRYPKLCLRSPPRRCFCHSPPHAYRTARFRRGLRLRPARQTLSATKPSQPASTKKSPFACPASNKTYPDVRDRAIFRRTYIELRIFNTNIDILADGCDSL